MKCDARIQYTLEDIYFTALSTFLIPSHCSLTVGQMNSGGSTNPPPSDPVGLSSTVHENGAPSAPWW